MELEALKTRLTTVQSLYEDENSSADDIVYATFGFVREAHTVAKLLLLEGRYAELQRCLHLCQRAFHPPQSEMKPAASLSSPSLSPSTSLRARGESTTLASLNRSPTAPTIPRVTPNAAATTTGSSHSGTAYVAAGSSRRASRECARAHDFPALQLAFWSFLNEEDIALFQALYQRTQRFQKQLDEARRTRPGRDTAYYIHKLVDNRGDYPLELRLAAVSHTSSSSLPRLHTPATVVSSSTAFPTAVPVLPSLRVHSAAEQTHARHTGAAPISSLPPPPPERGVSLGNRTKLNRWKIGSELPPFVTRSRTFLGNGGGEGDEDGEPPFASASGFAHWAAHTSHMPPLPTSVGSLTRHPSHSDSGLSHSTVHTASVDAQNTSTDVLLLPLPAAPASSVSESPRPPSRPCDETPRARRLTSRPSPLPGTPLPAMPHAGPHHCQSEETRQDREVIDCGDTRTEETALKQDEAGAAGVIDTDRPPAPTCLGAIGGWDAEDVEGLVRTLQSQVAPSSQRAAHVSAAVEKVLNPRRRSHDLSTESVSESATATTTTITVPNMGSSPAPVSVTKVRVHVGEVSARELSTVYPDQSRTRVSSMFSQSTNSEMSDDDIKEDTDGDSDRIPEAREGEDAVEGVAAAHPFQPSLPLFSDGTGATEGEPDTSANEASTEERLVLVTAECSADDKMRALDACRYQAYPQVHAVIYGHLLRQKAEEYMVFDRLAHTERKVALQPPVSASLTGLDASLPKTGFSTLYAPARRTSAEVGATTASYLRSQGHARMFESKTATRSQVVFDELRTADREIRRRSRALGLSATAEDIPSAGVLKRAAGGGTANCTDGGQLDGSASGSHTRTSIFLPNVFFVEDVDDDGGEDADDWESSFHQPHPGRTASTLSELKSTLTVINLSFRSKRALCTGSGPLNSSSVNSQNTSFIGLRGRTSSRKASLYSSRVPAGVSQVGLAGGRALRQGKSFVVGFTEQVASQHPQSDGTMNNANNAGQTEVSFLGASRKAPLESRLASCVAAVRIQMHWRAFAARQRVARLAKRVHRHRETEIRQAVAASCLQRFWRERQSKKTLRHRRALRDYIEERRVAEELTLYPSSEADLDVGALLPPRQEDSAAARRGSFYRNRPMRYASYASLSNAADGYNELGPRDNASGDGNTHSPTKNGLDGPGAFPEGGVDSFLVPAGANPRAWTAGRPRRSSLRVRSARNSFYMVPTTTQPNAGSRRGSLVGPVRSEGGRRSSLSRPRSAGTSYAPTMPTAAARTKVKTLATYGTPPTLSAARVLALRHIQRHVAARAITRFLRESIARGERRMQREVFALTHYLTGQWTRTETEAFIKEKLDPNAETGDLEAKGERQPHSPYSLAGQRMGENGSVGDRAHVDGSWSSDSFDRAARAAANAGAGTSFLAFISWEADGAQPMAPHDAPVPVATPLVSNVTARAVTATSPATINAGKIATGSVRGVAPRKPHTRPPSRTSRVNTTTAALSTDDTDDAALDIAALVERTTGDVYGKFVSRSIAARDAGSPLTVLQKVSLKALEAERQRLAAEAARVEEERQQRLRDEAEARRAREARRLEAVTLLQRVGRACRRRTWLRFRHKEVEDRRSLQYRSQLFTLGFAESSMPSLEGSTDLLAGGLTAVCGVEAEEALPAQSTLYIRHVLAARHPGWYSHDTRRQQATQTTSLVLTVQCFLRAHASTDVAFHLYLHQQATTVQRVWRGHRSRTQTAAMKAQVAKIVDIQVGPAALTT